MNSKEVSGQIIGTFKIQHILNERFLLHRGRRHMQTHCENGAAVCIFY